MNEYSTTAAFGNGNTIDMPTPRPPSGEAWQLLHTNVVPNDRYGTTVIVWTWVRYAADGTQELTDEDIVAAENRGHTKGQQDLLRELLELVDVAPRKLLRRDDMEALQQPSAAGTPIDRVRNVLERLRG
jgi:hypothetical protein